MYPCKIIPFDHDDNYIKQNQTDTNLAQSGHGRILSYRLDATTLQRKDGCN